MLHLQLGLGFAFFAAGLAICFAAMLVSKLLRPTRPNPDKLATYECGEAPTGPGQFRLNIRFYTMALIFIVFDVELVALLPTAVVFRDWLAAGMGSFALLEIFTFVGILTVGLIYVWRKGDIDWIKDLPEGSRG